VLTPGCKTAILAYRSCPGSVPPRGESSRRSRSLQRRVQWMVQSLSWWYATTRHRITWHLPTSRGGCALRRYFRSIGLDGRTGRVTAAVFSLSPVSFKFGPFHHAGDIFYLYHGACFSVGCWLHRLFAVKLVRRVLIFQRATEVRGRACVSDPPHLATRQRAGRGHHATLIDA
jgi:hypothetical protein